MMALCRMLSEDGLFAYCVSFFAGGFFLPVEFFLGEEGRGGVFYLRLWASQICFFLTPRLCLSRW